MKAILIINEPDACSHCDLVDASHTCFGAIASTSTNRSDVDDYYLMDTKPNWCPVKPLPQRLYYSDDDKRYVDGWDDCLDTLSGGEE